MKFSIIIPCYNCNETIERALDSIVEQNEKDLEVILVDDTPNKEFYSLVKPYKKKLKIKIVETEHKYHNPGNSRNYGLNIAEGDWVIFIDCDDMLRPNALDWFSVSINSCPNASFIFGLLKLFHPDGTEFSDNEDYQAHHLVWMHGKCYNRNFLNDHNIRFKNDMITCEDYYFNYQVMAHSTNENIPICDINAYVYNWMWNDHSLSRSNSYVMNIREHFYDHIEASLIPWTMIIPNQNPDYSFRMFMMYLKIDYYLYQYYLRKGIYFKKDIVRDALGHIYEKFGITVLDLINSFEDDYKDAMSTYKFAVGIVNEDFVCPESFRTWIMNMSIC